VGRIEGGWKLIRLRNPREWRLFHLESDPVEKEDRFAEEAGVARDMKIAIARHLAESRAIAARYPSAGQVPTTEIEDELRALGYL